jgi:hypothetical protein
MRVRKKLNGWQRLYVVLAVGLAGFNAVWFLREAPWGVIIRALNATHAEDIADEAVRSGRAAPWVHSGHDLLELTYPMSAGDFIEKYKDRNSVEYHKYLEAVARESAGWWQNLGLVALIWIIEIGLLYAFGWVVAWIRRGFSA